MVPGRCATCALPRSPCTPQALLRVRTASWFLRLPPGSPHSSQPPRLGPQTRPALCSQGGWLPPTSSAPPDTRAAPAMLFLSPAPPTVCAQRLTSAGTQGALRAQVPTALLPVYRLSPNKRGILSPNLNKQNKTNPLNSTSPMSYS